MSEPSANSPEAHLRQMLLDAHKQLLQRDEQIIRAIDRALPQRDDSEAEQLQKIVRQIVPAGAALLVISKGDDALLNLGETASHFPQDESGGYAWHHPHDSASAIEHLESLRGRGKGADYLLIPESSLWWLDHYAEFHQHLRNHYQVVWLDGQCAVFDLRTSAASSRSLRYSEEPDRSLKNPALRGISKTGVSDHAEVLLPLGVNVSGTFNSEKGTGEAVRSNIRSLAAAGVPFALNYVPDDSSSNRVESAGHAFQNDNPYAVNLIHLNPDCVLDFIDERGEAWFKSRYNIGYWVWELADFPDKWANIFRFFDEIWVPSDFVLDAISRVSPIPVVKIPHSVRDPEKPEMVDRARFGIEPSSFCFFFMFDFHSFIERKNPFGLIEAFRRAFGSRKDVQLLLKCSRSTPAELAQLQAHARGANVRLFDQVVNRSGLNAMMVACDCYVSLHRSEGFGLTLAEAMNLGKPVIATGYSGNMEFMTAANSFPVKYGLVTLTEDHGDYAKGSHWAEPDLDHAAELMRQIYSDRELRTQIAVRGQGEVREKLGAKAIGRLMSGRLKRIGEIRRPSPLAIAASSAIPPFSRVAVLSGGDDRLLQLAHGHNAIHFPHRQNGKLPDPGTFTDAQLLAHLEISREMGTQYLVVPSQSSKSPPTSPAFLEQLNARFRTVHDDRSCRIFHLSGATGLGGVQSVKIDLHPRAVYGMRLANGRWTSDGRDCHIIVPLSAPMYASAIRLIFSFVVSNASSSHAALTRVFWSLSNAADFDEDRCVNIKQRLAAQTQNRLIVVNEVIDQIRFDPDLQSAVLDRLELHILSPAGETAK
jgi:glycosyltransferase involved in cell wall biosynthesis